MSRDSDLTHRCWVKMHRRCNEPGCDKFAYYGGRGISVCARWSGPDGYTHFVRDMGQRPSPAHTLDRIDPDKHYEPVNCRWATWQQQQQNRRNNHLVTLRGETLVLTEWARRIGISETSLRRRLADGWSEERLFSESQNPRCYLELGGVRKTVRQWALDAGIPEGTLRHRLKRGQPLEEALRAGIGTTTVQGVAPPAARSAPGPVSRGVLPVDAGRYRLVSGVR